MDVTRAIQIAVARADLILCAALRRLPVVAALCAVLIVAVLAVRAGLGYDPYWIDYDRPGVDITSEGPEGDYTDAWYEWRDGDDSGHDT